MNLASTVRYDVGPDHDGVAPMLDIPSYGGADVEAWLDYPGCIAAVRAAMAALGAGGVAQPLRSIVPVAPAGLFALMPGALAAPEGFGAKVVTAYGDPGRPGRSTHRGVVVLFDRTSGAPACIADAGAVTHIRTACATAVATDALARPDATTLGLFGCGAQAESHVRALALVRPLAAVRVWGRSPERAAAFAARMAAETGLAIRAVADPRAAAACDILCTVTGAERPVLLGAWVRPGAHVNAVGSSHAGPVEVDADLVVKSRYVADSRAAALAAAAEFLDARAAGLIGDDHIAAEIGEVLTGRAPGRTDAQAITFYKSLGHVVQDLAAVAYLHARAAQRTGL